MTPNIAIIHVQNSCRRRHGFRLWIPLFLLWIPVLVLSPLILAGLFVLSIACWAAGIDFFRAVHIFWDILCSLPGTDVRVTADGNRVLVRIL